MNRLCFLLCGRIGLLTLCAGLFLNISTAATPEAVGVYAYSMEPRQHPDDARRFVKPPDRGTFKNKLQFISLRSLGDNYEEEIERYTKQDRLGDILWPACPMIFSENLAAMVQCIKQRELYLFDLWGFVPGSVGTGGYCGQFALPDHVRVLFENELGDRWLGMDNGEQDGRYVGRYAENMVPLGANRAEQYLHFQHHFERMGDLLGNRMATLISLNFGHYFLREGVYTMIGAETAQALPNSQVYYAFIRGAGKQYGVPWFGNISIYNRWGDKRYIPPNDTSTGPTKGTSLALMKRLLYSHILYNSVAVGFEAALYDHTNQLSPIGAIQQNAVKWSESFGDPGLMHTPIAVMVDFISGWSFPRHLYSGSIYKVWGALPYVAGDYLTDGILDLLYPGYQDSSYFHNERGFMSPTPFGDSADCLLSDAPGWLLRQYPVLVIAGELNPSAELIDTLTAYAQQGGHLILTAANAIRLFPEGLAGIRVLPETALCRTEQGEFSLHQFALSGEAAIICNLNGDTPAVASAPWEKGQVTIFASPYGVADQPQCALPAQGGVDRPLDKPFPLLAHVGATLATIFRSQMLFTAGDAPEVSVVTCRRGAGDYTVGLFNNTWKEQPFAITSLAGTITNLSECATDSAEKNAVGYLPEGISAVVGSDTDSSIAGGSMRVFRVLTDETRSSKPIQEIPFVQPPPNPTKRGLALRNPVSLKQEILLRPTFFRHFDTVLIDWRYLAQREQATLAAELGWLKRQGVRIVVDLSSGINLFPDLRLVNNDPEEYAHSMAVINGIMDKMGVFGSSDLIITLHHPPETNMAPDDHYASVTETCRTLARRAAEAGITLHLRQSPAKATPTLESLAHWITRIGEPNLKGAPTLALALGGDPAAFVNQLASFPCDLVLLSSPEIDIHGQVWNLNAPLCRYAKREEIKAFVNALKSTGRLLILDTICNTLDEEYLDACLMEGRW